MNPQTSSFLHRVLNLQAPWFIVTNEIQTLQNNQQEQHIQIGYTKGTVFTDATRTPSPIYGTKLKTWQHICNDKQPCYLNCHLPRIKTTAGKLQYVDVPWARPDSRFSWAYEAQIMQEIKRGKTFEEIAQSLGKTSPVIWRIFNGWIHMAYAMDCIESTLCEIGLAEISSSTGQQITVAIDLRNERVLRVISGVGKTALLNLHDYVKNKGFDPNQIKHITGPLSSTLPIEVALYFPEAEYHVDRFYIIQALDEAMIQIYKQETKHSKSTIDSPTLLLIPHSSLSEEHQISISELIAKFPNVGRAHKIKHLFYQVWDQSSSNDAKTFLERWCESLLATRMLIPFKELGRIFIEQELTITNFKTLPTHPEALRKAHANITAAIKRTKGLTNLENAGNMIYFYAGKLTLPNPLN